MAASSFQVQALLKSVRGGNWSTVVEIYEKYPKSHEVNIIKSGDTALHIAIANGVEHMVVQSLVSVCRREALAIGNERGETPLHLAAKVGSSSMCTYIAVKDASLIGSRNNNGETSLFVAVSHGRKDAFLCLNDFCKTNQHPYAYYGRKNGDTILHSAISLEFFDIAFYIIRDHPQLVHMVNKAEMSPLHVLASKPSCFPSGTHLTGLCKLLYHCISVSKLRGSDDDEVAKCVKKLFKRLFSCADSWNDTIHRLKVSRRENHQPDEEAAIERGNQTTFEATAAEPRVSRSRCLGWCRRSLSVYTGYASLRNVKQSCKWSDELMKELLQPYLENGPWPETMEMNEIFRPYFEYGPWPETMETDAYLYVRAEIPLAATPQIMETLLLIAAKNGVLELVEEILRVYPDAILGENTKKNIVKLAVENRHLPLYKFLLNHPKVTKDIFYEVDKHGNSALHIAAAMPVNHQPWRIAGAALQMHMEVKWYKFVKQSMPPDFLVRLNSKQETPGQIFRETHQKLIDDGREWLTKISQSCSLVAILIATVAFATSATVPGGVNQDKGTPILEQKPIFIISAVASLVALCSSMISVIMFLSILNSSFKHKDFHRDLPRKLLLGLISLLVSIVSMLLSFFAGHYFVMKEELKHRATLIYALVCIPLVFAVTIMFPLDFAVVCAILKKEPQ